MAGVAFNIVGPDGKAFRLEAPDGVTQDQLREKALAAKAQLAGAATRATPAAPATPIEPQSTTTTTTTSGGAVPPTARGDDSGGGIGLGTPEDPGLVGTALYRGLFRPAQQLASVMPGATRESLEARRAEKVEAGVPGAAGLPVEPAEGVLGTLGALASPLEAVAPWLWGAGTTVQWLTGDQDTADLIEGALGIGTLARAGARVIRGRRVPVVDDVAKPQYRGRTPAEARAIEQRDVTIPAAKRTADDAYRAQAAAESDVLIAKANEAFQLDAAARQVANANRLRDAAKAAEDAVVIRSTAAHNRVDTLRREYEAGRAAAAERPADAVRGLIGVPEGAPTARTAGELLTAAGEERQALAAAGAPPVGVTTARYKTADATRAAYANANAIATQRGVVLPLSSSTATEMLDAARTWAERVGKYAGPIERDAVGEILDVIAKGDVPYAALNDLHARLSTLALNPRDYAATASVAKKELTRFKFAVQTALRTLEVSTPELADAASAARTAAREGEKVRQTAKALVGRTPEDAFAAMVANPTHLRRVMQHAGVAEQDAYRMAYWHDAVERATDATGTTNIDTLLSMWNGLPPESRQLLASGATANARIGMAELAGDVTKAGALKGELTAAEAAVKDTLQLLKAVQRQWRTAAKRAGVPPEKYAGVVQARRDFVAAEKDAASRAGDAAKYRRALALEQKTLRELGGLTPAGGHPPEHAWSLLLYHGFQALRAILGGGISFGALTHGGLAFSLSRHPKLIRDTITMPVASPHYDLAAQGLAAALRGWRGMTEPEPEAAPAE